MDNIKASRDLEDLEWSRWRPVQQVASASAQAQISFGCVGSPVCLACLACLNRRVDRGSNDG